ncbi:MAG: DUF4976 domain-containing protein [Chitinivibrionales bacterium]|nr:DUF4976 domain-containing protein [Chitinivibrionales bacterium]MBD3356939.1 DUF4976 domain-containing protein [Chitinivibrionales bacterium]
MLDLAGIAIPETVEGKSFADHIREGTDDPSGGAAVVACYHPFGQYLARDGGREYRGLITTRYTYARDLIGPWLLYDNKIDPYQLNNLVNNQAYAEVRAKLEKELQKRLDEQEDEFLPGMEYIRKWGYAVDETGTVPYH